QECGERRRSAAEQGVRRGLESGRRQAPGRGGTAARAILRRRRLAGRSGVGHCVRAARPYEPAGRGGVDQDARTLGRKRQEFRMDTIQTIFFDFGNVIAHFDHGRTVRRLSEREGLDEKFLHDILYAAPRIDDYERGAITTEIYIE